MDKDTIKYILKILEELYPTAAPELVYHNSYQLLLAVILSAQCTDIRVNLITPLLFIKYPNVYAMAEANIDDVETIIKTCGLFHNKALALVVSARQIVENHSGNVPNTIEGLMSLRGVGRKTANVIYSVAFGGEAIAVDTHVFRVSKRIGLADSNNVRGVEEALMKLIESKDWSHAHHLLLFHGRRCCKANIPKCTICKINNYCKYFNRSNE